MKHISKRNAADVFLLCKESKEIKKYLDEQEKV